MTLSGNFLIQPGICVYIYMHVLIFLDSAQVVQSLVYLINICEKLGSMLRQEMVGMGELNS